MSFRTLLILLTSLAALAAFIYITTRAPHIVLPLLSLIVFASLASYLFAVRVSNKKAKQALSELPTPSHPPATIASVPAATLLEATMESMREAVIVVDSAMRVVAANRAANDIFNSSDEVLTDKRLTELTRNASVHQAFQSALETNERAEVKVETSTADARGRRAFDIRVAPLRYKESGTSEHETSGAVGVFFDITRLERLERVRQEFLSNVSHELRTPLTAILTFIETLQDGAIDDEANNRRFLNIISRNAVRMHNLIDDILELSAIEAGTVRVEPITINLHHLVEDIITALAPRAREREIKLVNTIAPATKVFADPRRLEQMITNLIDNAIKFSSERGTVSVAYEQAGARDRITVTDTGEGIAPEHLPRIFERFYRVDRARSRDMGGTGLGLAIVKHLARAHGGEASVTSTLGQGSRFAIELAKDSDTKSLNEKTESTAPMLSA